MPNIVTIMQVEAAINRARVAHPAVDHTLSPQVCVLAELYASHLRATTLDVDQLPECQRAELLRWLEPAPACAYRPGQDGFDACEACQ